MTFFGEHKCLPTLAATHIQRPSTFSTGSQMNTVTLMDSPFAPYLKPVTQELLQHWRQFTHCTAQCYTSCPDDTLVAGVYKHVMEAWPSQIEVHLKVFFTKINDLTTEQGCVLWGTRITILPQKMRKAVLKQIHSGHQGIVKTKALACKFVWWPGLDSYAEQMCREQELRQLEQKKP